MFEDRSVDTLASVILTDVKSGVIDPRMLRRFYRRGKKDARRLSYEPSREYIVHAVALATSKICEDYVADRERMRDERSSLIGQIEQAHAQLDQMGPDLRSVPMEDGPTVMQESGTPGSLERLAEVRTMQRHQQARARREGIMDGVADLTRQLTAVDDRLHSLPMRYEQAAASCREVGNLLWARYCMGFERGKRRRVSPDDSLDGPPSDLAFETPCDFATPIPNSDSERTS